MTEPLWNCVEYTKDGWIISKRVDGVDVERVTHEKLPDGAALLTFWNLKCPDFDGLRMIIPK